MKGFLAGLAALAAFAATLVATPAMATVTAADPALVARAMVKMGYRAELGKDESGDPYITSASSGSTFLVFFFGCKKGVNCTTVQFFAGFDKPSNASLAAMNQWNRDNRFGRGYLADNGSARLEMDLDLDDGGMSDLLFADNVEFWVAIMAKFEKYVRRK